MWFEASPGPVVHKTYLRKAHHKKGLVWSCSRGKAQQVEALSSNPRAAKKKKRRRIKRIMDQNIR
jgi:hypothetical protein